MKNTYSILRTSCAALASCVLFLFSSCVKEGLEKTGTRSSNEVKIAASVASSPASNVTKSTTGFENVINTQSEILEFKSADGSIVLPLMFSLTEETNYASTKGSYINGPNDDGIFPTGNLPLQKALNSFTMEAYYTDSQSPFVPANSKVEYKDSKWTLNKTYYWPQSTNIDFYAYANMPTAQGVSIEKDKEIPRQQRLYYQVPDDTKNQTDILMAVYSGTGNTNGEAELVFRHPLTSVWFQCDRDDPKLHGVTHITMGGVHFKGEAVQSLDASGFKWENVAGSEIVEQDNDGKPFVVHGEINGDPFLLIPQDLAEKNVDLTVILIIDGHEIPLNSTLYNVNWEAGKTYTYTITYDGFVEIKMSMDSESATVKTYPVIKNTGFKKCYVRTKAIGYITNIDHYVKSTWLNDDRTIKGTFVVSSGTFGTGTWNEHWVAGTDGFWYYTIPLEWTGDETARKTTPLFDSYSFTNLNPGEYFEMAISSQAVEWDEEKEYVKETWGVYAASLLN